MIDCLRVPNSIELRFIDRSIRFDYAEIETKYLAPSSRVTSSPPSSRKTWLFAVSCLRDFQAERRNANRSDWIDWADLQKARNCILRKERVRWSGFKTYIAFETASSRSSPFAVASSKTFFWPKERLRGGYACCRVKLYRNPSWRFTTIHTVCHTRARGIPLAYFRNDMYKHSVLSSSRYLI